MSIKTSDAVLGIAAQVAKGTPNAVPDVFAKYLEGDSAVHEMETTALREGGDDEQIGTFTKNMHKVMFTFKIKARPEIITFLIAWLLGKDVLTGATDPFTHTMTRLADGRKYLTVRRKIETTKTEQIEDAKIEKISIESEAGKEVEITVEGQGLRSTILAAEDTPVFEVESIFMFYHGVNSYVLDGVTERCIKSFAINIQVTSQDGLQSDEVTMKDLQDLMLDIDWSADLFADNDDRWQKANYNNGTAISTVLFEGAFIVELNFLDPTTGFNRQLKITIPASKWEPVQLPFNSEPAVTEETVAGIARRPDAGEIITVVTQNAITPAVV